MTSPRVWRGSRLAAVVLASCVQGGTQAAEPEAGRRLTVAEAERLAADDRELVLALPDVRRLDPDVAAALARCRSVLVLSGLTDLSPDVAAALAACPGAVDLSGLRSLSPAAARALAAYRGPRLDLSGVWPVTAEVAELSRVAAVRLDSTRYRRLRRLTLHEAQILVRLQEWNGELPALEELSADVAAVLVTSGRHLMLTGLRTVGTETARVLARAESPVRLSEATQVEEGIAKELLAAAPNVQFPVATLTVDLARAFATRPGDVVLSDLTDLSGPDAVAIARIFGERGGVALPQMRRITSQALEALLETKRDIVIPPLAELEIVPEADGSTDDLVVPEWFLGQDPKRAP